jgi:hypothetical protein
VLRRYFFRKQPADLVDDIEKALAG